MIEIEEHPAGAVLPVRAQPGAAQSAVRGQQAGRLKVSVTQVAEKGKANKAILKLLAKWLGVRRSQIEWLSGETSADKRLLVRDVTTHQLAEMLRVAAARR